MKETLELRLLSYFSIRHLASKYKLKSWDNNISNILGSECFILPLANTISPLYLIFLHSIYYYLMCCIFYLLIYLLFSSLLEHRDFACFAPCVTSSTWNKSGTKWARSTCRMNEWVKCAMNEQCVSCTLLHVGNAIVYTTGDNFALRNALSNPHLSVNKIF